MTSTINGYAKLAVGAGETLTLTTDALSSGRWGQLPSQATGGVADVPSAFTALAASSTVVLGGQATPSRWYVESTTGQLQYTAAPASPPVPEIANPATVIRLYGAGAPSATTGLGIAGTASEYIDTTNAQMYLNAGTSLSPSWKELTRAA